MSERGEIGKNGFETLVELSVCSVRRMKGGHGAFGVGVGDGDRASVNHLLALLFSTVENNYYRRTIQKQYRPVRTAKKITPFPCPSHSIPSRSSSKRGARVQSFNLERQGNSLQEEEKV